MVAWRLCAVLVNLLLNLRNVFMCMQPLRRRMARNAFVAAGACGFYAVVHRGHGAGGCGT